MRYLMLLYRNEQAYWARTDAERLATANLHQPYIEMLKAKGHYLGSELLGASGSATTLRTENGKPVVTDGPFAETREQLGGFYLIEAKDLDEALALLKQMPGIERIAAEVRPIVKLPW
jgi:hypothetical protein